MRINSLSPVNTVSGTNSQGMEKPQIQTQETVSVVGKNNVSEKFVTSDSLDMSNQDSEDGKFSEEMLERSIQQANKNLKNHNRVVERAVHEVTGTVMYTVRDTSTHEVIAEFPPKRIQDMIAKMWELAGLFVDEKA